MIVKFTPVSASKREISFSMYKSAPFLLKILLGLILITTTTSPASTSGTWSPSPWIVNYSPLGEPLSISTLSFFLSRLTFLPLQALHLFSMLIISPWPLQCSQGPVDWEYIPGPICLILVTIPLPLQCGQVTTAVASVPPIPSQTLQTRYLSTSTSISLPL